MYFLHPTYLWALLGLAVPIAIHLWSRKEGKTIRVGSLQLFEETDTRQRSNLRLNEYWLLLLRLLVLSLLVLLLASPQLEKKAEVVPLTYLVEPSLLQDRKLRSFLDSLAPEAPLRLLQKGFPEVEGENLAEGARAWDSLVPDYWQLARELEQLHTDSIVVFSRASLSGIKGMRPAVSPRVHWVVLDPVETQKTPLHALKKEQEILLTTLVSDSRHLSFEKQKLPLGSSSIRNDSLHFRSGQQPLPVASEEALRIHLYYHDSLSAARRLLEASFQAIATYLDRPLELHSLQKGEAFPSGSPDLLVWLDASAPAPTRAPRLLFRPDSLSTQLIQPGPYAGDFHLTHPLHIRNVTREQLPEQLLQLLHPHGELEETIRRLDQRSLPREAFLPRNTASVTPGPDTRVQDLSPWLWIFVLVFVLSERLLAYKRKQ